MADGDETRAFVLGLDGVPWDLLSEWVEAGELPNFETVFEEGAAGPMLSTTPATTALAWPSIATGVWPGKHGVYDFQHLTRKHTHRMNTSADVRAPELWRLVGPSVVGNVPMTYPPDEIDGAMVTGMMTPSTDAAYTHPPSLKDRIERDVPGYQIGLNWNEYGGRTEEFLTDHSNLLRKRRQLMRFLEEEPWRLFFFVYTGPDRLQHLVWDESVLLEHYRYLDDILGGVLESVEEADANLFIVSDHGFGPISKVVSVNSALEDAGLVTRKASGGTRSTLTRLGVTKSRVNAALDSVGVDESTLLRYLPRSVVDSVASQVPGDHQLYDVDYAETVAFVHGTSNVYVNDTERFDDGAVDPADVSTVKAHVERALEDLTDPETGERVLDVFDGDDLFPDDPESPDVVVETRPGYGKSIPFTDEPVTKPAVATGFHRPEGIFLAWGPDVEAGSRPEDATVVDVAPTVLQTLGEAIPEATDGRILDEVFADDSAAAERDAEYRTYDDRTTPAVESAANGDGDHAGDVDHDDGEDNEAQDDFDDVEERLRGLGYME